MPHFAGQHGSTAGTITYMDNTDKSDAPKQSRRAKIAADFAYTLNHAIVCTLTDPITDAPIGATVQNMMAAVRADNDGKVTFRKLLEQLTPGAIWGGIKETFGNRQALKSWFAGEFAGDFGAVPVVVAVQNFAPWLVNGIRKAFTPLMGPIFRRSAERSARREFEFAKMEAKGPEFQQRVEELYNKEMEHLPNAVLWTVASPAINIAMQKLVIQKRFMKDDEPAPVVDLLLGKAIGATITSSLTVGLRTLAPEKAQKWDNWMSSKASGPVAGMVSKVAGVDKDELKKEMKARSESEHRGGKHSEKFDKARHVEEKYGKKATDDKGGAWTQRVEDKEEERTKGRSYGLAS